MSRLLITDTRTLENILLSLGFKLVRQKGSHAFYRHPDGRYTTLPLHGNKNLARPLVRQIIKEINITIEEYNEFVRNKGKKAN
jgi:predicted RNA binding protein YcfA (HicA-like mRNA interferase family)